MKKLLSYFSVGLVWIFFLTSCKKYDSFQTNPNQPVSATPALLLTGISYNIFYTDNTTAAFATRHLTYYERGNSAVDYSWTAGSFDNYNILRQVVLMDSLAVVNNKPEYLGLTKIFRAILFSEMTETFGEIPYSQALQGFSYNFKPTYDTQEDIYKGLLSELEEANTLLAEHTGNIEGDIIYNGKAKNWQKLANSFKLRLLIHLSKKAGNSSIDVAAQFASIVNDPTGHPIFESNADNAQMVFNTTAQNNYYPDFGYLSLATLVSLEKGFAKILKDRQDPRLFAFAEPVGNKPAGVFDNYEGVNAGLTIGDQQSASAGASRIKKRYYSDMVNEPWVLISYGEQELNIAEGIQRGWAAGNAKQHYENGVSASMQFYGVAADKITGYLSQPLVAYNASNALTQITIQKHIALFMNSGWEAFFEQRRTGIPTLNVGPGTYNEGRVPKRWLYPQSEYNYNAENLQASLQRQYSRDDDQNESMWLIK